LELTEQLIKSVPSYERQMRVYEEDNSARAVAEYLLHALAAEDGTKTGP
jgi:hypothetical protein